MRAGGSSNNSHSPVILIYRSRDHSFIVIRGEGWSLARTEGGARAKGKRSIVLRMPIGPCGIFTSVRGPSLIVSSNRPRLAWPERRRLIHMLRLVLRKCDFLRRFVASKNDILYMYALYVLYKNLNYRIFALVWIQKVIKFRHKKFKDISKNSLYFYFILISH